MNIRNVHQLYQWIRLIMDCRSISKVAAWLRVVWQA